MNIQKIAPELRTAFSHIPTIPYHNRFLLPFLKLMFRLGGRTELIDGVIIETYTVGTAQVRVYRPKNGGADAGLLWIHGGGFVVGGAAQDDNICSNYVKALRLTVFSVEYRLAPAHPFPAALDDCYAVWRWLQAQYRTFGIDPARIAIAGQSAGGGLAACLAQRIVDDGGMQPVAQLLFCPMLDDCTSENRQLDGEKHPVWNNENNRGGWSAYLGHRVGRLNEPAYAVAARREKLSGLPPTWIGIGDIDLFYEECCHYAGRLRDAGVPCELDIVPMAPHAFHVIAPDATISQTFYQRHYRYMQNLTRYLQE